MQVQILQFSEEDFAQGVRTPDNKKLCFVYGLAVRWPNSRIVAPQFVGSNPIQVATKGTDSKYMQIPSKYYGAGSIPV